MRKRLLREKDRLRTVGAPICAELGTKFFFHIICYRYLLLVTVTRVYDHVLASESYDVMSNNLVLYI